MWTGGGCTRGKLTWPEFLAAWIEEDRPKYYRKVIESTEGKWTAKDISEMSIPQYLSLEHERRELSFADAKRIIAERKKKSGN